MKAATDTVQDWFVYLLECADGRVYTGIARDPLKRLAQHRAGKGARFTRANPPRQLLGWVRLPDKSAALRQEIAWKRLPRAARVAALHAHPGFETAPGTDTLR